MTADTFPKSIDISQRKAASPRVLLVRLSAVGDCIQTMPLACAVRDQWPDAHLTWVVEKGAAPLVQACDAVDRLIVVPKGFARSLRLLLALRRELRRSRFDFALDPQGLTKSGLVAFLSGAQRRIGFARPQAREINPWLQTEQVTTHSRHRVPQYLELLRPLAVNQSQHRIRFGLRIPHTAEQAITDFVYQPALRGGFVVLNPGAGWDSKRWPVERYAEVARDLAGHGIKAVVAWGGKEEEAWAKTIVEQSRGAAVQAPPTSLLELAALLAKARLFVGSDTGPLHLAAALGTPCVALFGASSGVACGPFGPGHVMLQDAHDESSGRKRKGADNWAMRKIAVNAVCSACDRLLGCAAKSSPAARAA
jgi:lipopolysaccharide heptosyltransferase I